MLPKTDLALQILSLRRKIPANSSNVPLTLPAVAGHTYILCRLDITCDNAFSYQAVQGATVIATGEGNSTNKVESWFGDNGLSTNEDNAALSINVLSVGNYDVNISYKIA